MHRNAPMQGEGGYVEGLNPVSQEPPSSADANAAVPSPSDGWAPSGPQIRPWVRFLARLFDRTLLVAITFVPFRAATIYLSLLMVFRVLVFAFLFVLLESALLAKWGTTPGKALLRVRVRKEDGSKPTFRQAFGRSLRVCFWGEGLILPLANIIANINGYSQLTKKGVTSWDKIGKFQVTHQRPGRLRVCFAIALFFLYFGTLRFLQANYEFFGGSRRAARGASERTYEAVKPDTAPYDLLDTESSKFEEIWEDSQ